jgi:hypothetical protein
VTKTPKQAAATAAAQHQAKIKVGRWTYDATIFSNGTAAYITKLGGLKNADAGTFTEIN